MDHSGVITGQKYQSLRTQIMKAEGGDKVGEAVKALRKEFDNIAAKVGRPAGCAGSRGCVGSGQISELSKIC